MKGKRKIGFIFWIIILIFISSCVMLRNLFSPPEFVVTPDKTVISPDLLKNPITFTGSGWKPGEMVVVELILPPHIQMKGVKEGEDVGIAFANADDNGKFKTSMGASATLNWLFQVGWTPLLQPDFKEAKPLPPGKYTIRATGLDSELRAEATLQILPPPEKK
jgi:hypothetical protein